MALCFNADEVFGMAIKIEENGSRFYRKAAEILNDPDVTRLLIELAETEDEHAEIFRDLRESLSNYPGGMVEFETDEYSEPFLSVWADGRIFDFDSGPGTIITGNETLEDVLKLAIEAEKDSIVFYLGMKESIPDERNRNRIDLIIWEELEHFATLRTRLKKLEGC